MSVSPARVVALGVISRVRRDAAFSGAVLAAELKTATLGVDDTALATRLAYGTLATQGVLDDVLDRFVRGGLEPRVRDALRLGTYELLFSRAPAYAVVDQAVDAVRRIRPQAASLANAVMRKVTDIVPEFPFGDPASDPDALAMATGTPAWIVETFRASLGEEAAREALWAGLEAAPTYVRLDPFAADPSETRVALAAAGAEPEPSPPDSDCLLLGRPSAAFGTGTTVGFFAMDAAAQIAPACACPAPGLRILDIGAGRGNKTVCLQALAVRAGGPAAVTALDRHPGKADVLRGRIEASGIPGVEVVIADAECLQTLPGFGGYDVALLDAPCTGLGTLRRYPEKRWRLAPSDPARMAAVQLDMLRAAAAVIRPGGSVVYSTCSVASAENGDVLGVFLGEEGRRFVVEPLDSLVPGQWQRYVDASGCFGSWPTIGGPDGHFVARLRHVEG